MSSQTNTKSYRPISTKLSCGHQKSSHQIQRRNERERKRVHQINLGYQLLSRTVPTSPSRKLSKLETLREAVRYIRHLQCVLEQTEADSAELHPQASSLFTSTRLPPLDRASLFQYETNSTPYTHLDYMDIQWKSTLPLKTQDSCSTY